MNWILTLAVIRILAYAMFAMYALTVGRWWVWIVFTGLTLSTYIYAFVSVEPAVVEVVRTCVGAGLIYIMLRRK